VLVGGRIIWQEVLCLGMHFGFCLPLWGYLRQARVLGCLRIPPEGGQKVRHCRTACSSSSPSDHTRRTQCFSVDLALRAAPLPVGRGGCFDPGHGRTGLRSCLRCKWQLPHRCPCWHEGVPEVHSGGLVLWQEVLRPHLLQRFWLPICGQVCQAGGDGHLHLPIHVRQ